MVRGHIGCEEGGCAQLTGPRVDGKDPLANGEWCKVLALDDLKDLMHLSLRDLELPLEWNHRNVAVGVEVEVLGLDRPHDLSEDIPVDVEALSLLVDEGGREAPGSLAGAEDGLADEGPLEPGELGVLELEGLEEAGEGVALEVGLVEPGVEVLAGEPAVDEAREELREGGEGGRLGGGVHLEFVLYQA